MTVRADDEEVAGLEGESRSDALDTDRVDVVAGPRRHAADLAPLAALLANLDEQPSVSGEGPERFCRIRSARDEGGHGGKIDGC